MGILGWIFHLLVDSLVNFWTYLMFRDTSKLPRAERPEARAEAIAAGVTLLGAMLVFALVFAYVSLT